MKIPDITAVQFIESLRYIRNVRENCVFKEDQHGRVVCFIRYPLSPLPRFAQLNVDSFLFVVLGQVVSLGRFFNCVAVCLVEDGP